jgi:D-lactate dehydrogenase
MKVAFFSTKPYEKEYFDRLNASSGHEITYFEPRLNEQTAAFAEGSEAVCIFVNDDGSAPVLKKLAKLGIRVVALRCAGFNNVDLKTGLDLKVVRVPAYSPYAVAEHTVALILTLNRKTHRAYNRVREGNYSLNGLVGFDLHGKTVGMVGTGKIGMITAKILSGFGCRVLGYDLYPNPEFAGIGGTYTSLEVLYRESDIISLHTPLTPETYHMLNADTIGQMKDGVMIINTSRGKLIDTRDLIHALKCHKVGYVGLDVYEEEADLFFEDLSNQMIEDEVFLRLLTFPNVLVTGHQAFLTKEALTGIAQTTLQNLTDFEAGKPLVNEVKGG